MGFSQKGFHHFGLNQSVFHRTIATLEAPTGLKRPEYDRFPRSRWRQSYADQLPPLCWIYLTKHSQHAAL